MSVFLAVQCAIAISSEWEGRIVDSSATLANSERHTILLKRDPSFPTTRGNNFGVNGGTNFEYRTNGGSSTIILQKDPNTNSSSTGSDMQYYHNSGNTISVYSGSNLIMNLDSTGSSGGFIISGSINANDGNIAINDVNTLSILDGGRLIVENGGSMSINGVTRFIITTMGNAPSILNNGGTLTINSDVYSHNKPTSGNSTNGGYIRQTGGTTTITGNLHNIGYYNVMQNGARQSALLQVEGGSFNVAGNLTNGERCSNAIYGVCYGIGYVEASNGAVINVSGAFSSNAEGGAYRSSVRLENATLKANSITNGANSDIYLTGSARIEATSGFVSESGSTTNFIGAGSGFGVISAARISINDNVGFSLGGTLKKTNDLRYLFLESNNVSGINTSAISITDSSGLFSDRYSARIEQNGNQYFIALHKVSSGTSGLRGAIANALDNEYIILRQSDLDNAAQTIQTQIADIQEQYRAIEASNVQYTMLGRITQTYANLENKKIYFAQNISYKTRNDYRIPFFDTRQKQHSLYVNALVGYNAHKGSSGSSYGINLGYDGRFGDQFFGGVVASVKKRSLNGIMQLDSIDWYIGGYGRVYLPQSLELDTLIHYGNAITDYTKSFSLSGQNLTQAGAYSLHNFAIQTRLGLRKEFGNKHSIKPYVGAFGGFYHTPAFRESGTMALGMDSNSFLSLYGALGIEYRKIFTQGSLFIAVEGVGGTPVFGKNYTITMGNQILNTENPSEFFGNFFGGANFIINSRLEVMATLLAQAYHSGYYNIGGSAGVRLMF